MSQAVSTVDSLPGPDFPQCAAPGLASRVMGHLKEMSEDLTSQEHMYYPMCGGRDRPGGAALNPKGNLRWEVDMAKKKTLSGLQSIIAVAAVLWLAVACGDDAPMGVTPPDQTMATSQMSYMTPVEAVVGPWAIPHKYQALFWRQPNVHGVGIGNIKDENGERTEKVGFIIKVTEKVDQRTLPSEDRIPDMIEGVIVQIQETPKVCLEDEKQETATATKEESMDTSQTSYMDPDEAVAKARAIRHKYDALFWRQPNVHSVGIGNIRDENDEKTGRVGFIIRVTEKVDQNTLCPEDRIPDMIEGVEVEMREQPIGTIGWR